MVKLKINIQLLLKYDRKNISQEFRLKNKYKTRNYFLEEIKQNELMSRKHKKVCIEHFLILNSTIAGCISIFAFTS